ncbi:LIC_10705 family lipoprotein [Leptospira sp. WS4.C2]
MKTISFILLSTLSLFGCFRNSDPRTAGIPNDQLAPFLLFFVVPNLDFNQYCPATDQIPILEPGTYNRYMAAGDTYIFDNRARLNAKQTWTSAEYFTFSIQENPGQEVKLTSPWCGNSSSSYPARNDSNLSGQLETVRIPLKVPPLPVQRYGFFTTLTIVSGSGTISFTTPSVQDPPQ